MTRSTCRFLVTSVSLLATSLVFAWWVRVTAPTIPPTEARILAFATPGEIVAGERATLFGALQLPATGPVWHRLDVCEAASGSCRSLADVRLVDPEPTWVGVAGHLSLDRPGTYVTIWRVFVDTGLDTPWVADETSARIDVLEARDARE